MDASSPPRYRRFSTRPGPVPLSGSELPPYTRRNTLTQPVNLRREPTEHVFQLSDGKPKPWVTLKIYSSAKSSKSLPTFFEKEDITGQVELDAERGDSIQAVTAVVCFFVVILPFLLKSPTRNLGDWSCYHGLRCRRLLRFP